jgi:hypothetical protein
MRHDLKCWPDEFAAIERGEKLHEIRRADRPYAVGDVLALREWMPGEKHACRYSVKLRCVVCGKRPRDRDDPSSYSGEYTGRSLERVVTHLTPGGAWGLPPDLCVMSIAPYSSAREEWTIEKDLADPRERERYEDFLRSERPTKRCVCGGMFNRNGYCYFVGGGNVRHRVVSIIPPPQTPSTAGDTPAK